MLEHLERVPDPKVIIKSVNEIGHVHLMFNQPMLLSEIFDNYKFKP